MTTRQHNPLSWIPDAALGWFCFAVAVVLSVYGILDAIARAPQ